jgi:hypothetical protein
VSFNSSFFATCLVKNLLNYSKLIGDMQTQRQHGFLYSPYFVPIRKEGRLKVLKFCSLV